MHATKKYSETIKKHKMKRVYYAVRKGRVPGIYGTWYDCKKNVNGFAGAEHKKIYSLAEATKYMEGVRYKANAPVSRELWPDEKGLRTNVVANGPNTFQVTVSQVSNKLVVIEREVQADSIADAEFIALVLSLEYCKKYRDAATIYSSSQVALERLNPCYVQSPASSITPSQQYESTETDYGAAINWLQRNHPLNFSKLWHPLWNDTHEA
jgi:viroplasmin and RNaseH domain-containing protein